MTTYSERWCEWYCAETVRHIRDALDDIHGDVDHELDYPDQYPHGTSDQIPTISHEVMYTLPETAVAQFVWTPRDGWGYYLKGDNIRTDEPRPMSLGVDAPPRSVAAESRRVIDERYTDS